MATAIASLDLPVPPEVVWQLIGGFGSLPDWLPYIPTSELSDGGRIRTLANPNGEAIVERLVSFDEVGRSYTYAILKAPFPVVDYRSTLQVLEIEEGKSSKVVWKGQFTAHGSTDAEVTKLFTDIYTGGLHALEARIGASQKRDT